MGHPAAVESTQDLRPFGELWAGSGLLSAAPPGLVPFSSGIPTACAVGCILSPLRGCGRDRSEGSQNPQPSRLRAADRDASTALPVCHSRRETGERRGSKYQWVEGCGIPLLAKNARNGAAGGAESTQDLRPFGELGAGCGLLSAAPPGLVPFSSGIPTACAVGCILSPLRGCGRDRSEVKIPNRHASVPRIGMLRLRSRFVTRAGKPGSGEGQNTNGLRVVESHFSQRTREMGHPSAVVVRAEKQVPRLRVSVLRTITLRSG